LVTDRKIDAVGVVVCCAVLSGKACKEADAEFEHVFY